MRYGTHAARIVRNSYLWFLGGIGMTNLSNFLFLVVVLVLVPGPDYVIITKNTMVSGAGTGFRTLLGTLTALLCHTLFAVVGLSALIMKSALLFSVLKYIGAAYLIYLGLKSLVAKKGTAQEMKSRRGNPYMQGLLTNLLNPKVALFFLTFLPQFIQTDNQSWLPFAVLGLIYVAVTAFLYSLYVLLLKRVSAFMGKPEVQRGIDKLSGVVLVVFGIKLFLEKA